MMSISFSQNEQRSVIMDFESDWDPSDWQIINDGVMGGLSESSMMRADSGWAVYQGNISLANNGGFASTRTRNPSPDLSACQGIGILIRGDGRRYSLRLRMDGAFDGISYEQRFRTTADVWEEQLFKFSAFKPVFRGRQVPDAPDLNPAKIRQIGILISDKQSGRFQIEIRRIFAF